MVVQPIDSAPVDDRWYLIQETRRGDQLRHSPWVIATRGDGGWHDDDGYPIDAIAWTALPDPQPKPTGWSKAVGTIFVCNGWLGDDRQPVWVIGVTLPDGRNDDDRDWDMRSTKQEALTAAVLLSARLDLPWVEMPYVEESSNVVPFALRGSVR